MDSGLHCGWGNREQDKFLRLTDECFGVSGARGRKDERGGLNSVLDIEGLASPVSP